MDSTAISCGPRLNCCEWQLDLSTELRKLTSTASLSSYRRSCSERNLTLLTSTTRKVYGLVVDLCYTLFSPKIQQTVISLVVPTSLTEMRLNVKINSKALQDIGWTLTAGIFIDYTVIIVVIIWFLEVVCRNWCHIHHDLAYLLLCVSFWGVTCFSCLYCCTV